MENLLITKYVTAQISLGGLNDSDLVWSAQQGDLEAFNQIVLGYQDRIFTLALRLLGDEDSAEDITQNTFLAAYHSLPHFRNGSLRSWLYRIATNASYDEIRSRKRHPILPLEDEESKVERFMRPDDCPGSCISPEEAYERCELEQEIQEGLNQLAENRRVVVILVDLQGLDYLEAAQILKVSVGTVKSRLARARAQLLSYLNVK